MRSRVTHGGKASRDRRATRDGHRAARGIAPGIARGIAQAWCSLLLGCTLLLGVVALAPACTSGQSTTMARGQAAMPQRFEAAPVSPDRVYSLLAELAADSMEGRATGEPGALRAATMIAREMRAAGLEAASDSGYFQRVPTAITTIIRLRDGQEFRREGLTMLSDFDALDTIPAARHRRSVNVIGVLRGSDPSVANEHILVGAHYDHVGIGQPVNGDSIYNGADDDASGTIAVLEIARALAAGPRPRRTIVFAATTGEEMGLLGTRWYIANPILPMDQMVADLQIEMIGRPDSLAGGPGRAWLTGYERSTMGNMLADNGIPIVPDARPDQNFFMRSDNIAFARLGIPAHTLSSFNLHTDYHRPSDEVQHTDRVHMAAVIDATIQAVWHLANGPKPEWHSGLRPCGQGEQPRAGVCTN